MESKDLMPIPQVLLVDCTDDIRGELIDHRFSVNEATFGKDITVEYDRYGKASLPLLNSVPQNIQEHEVIIIDMCGVDNAISMKDVPEDHNSLIRYSVETPNRTFYSSMMSSRLMFEGERKPTKAIYVVFEGDYLEGAYQATNIRDRSSERVFGCTYDFLKNIIEYNINVNRKIGKRTITADENELNSILAKYKTSFSYLATFDHPLVYDSNTKLSTKHAGFFPLVLNDSNEIISFICFSEGNIVLILPQTNRKRELIIELLEDFFPTVVPEFFPESTKFLWLSDQKYALPNTDTYEVRKQAIKDEYIEKLKLMDAEIFENKKRFGYLHDLLVETDNQLVNAVIDWFKWLGFQSVIDVDQEKGTKQEDINIVEDDYIIIAEVKGIGGTSTDDECSQIRKHRRRFEKENKGKDIIPIYIVNHQRYISPELRRNPPFTKEQIEYAKHDERGLITTYQLFTWHRLVCDGIFNADEIKEVFTQFGAIPLIPPQYIFLGVIKEYFAKSKALILSLENCEIKTGDTLLFEKDGFLQKSEIVSIQDSGVFVEKTANGEVGISVDLQLGKGFSTYLCPRSK